MFTSEQLINAMMMGKITDDEYNLGLDIALAVERGITCPVTGIVMDSRTAVAIQTDQKDGTKMVALVVHPSVLELDTWESVSADLDKRFPDRWRTVTATEIFKKVKG